MFIWLGELKMDNIKRILSSNVITSELFGVIKSSEGNYVKIKLNSHQKLDDTIVKMIKDTIDKQYLKEDINLIEITELNENKNNIYRANLKDFDSLNFLSNINEKDSVNEENLKAFIIKISDGKDDIYCYQNIAVNAIIKHYNRIPIIRSEDFYEQIDSNVVVIESKVDFILYNNTLYIKNWKLLENQFQFTDFIKSNADKTLQNIKDNGLLDDMSKIIKEAESKLPISKKLMRAGNSLVLKKPKEQILTNAKSIEQYKPLFNEDGAMVVKTCNDVKLFIKLLNDDMLYSKLTDGEYDASDKVLIDKD